MRKFLEAWCLIYIKPRQENKVANQLSEREIKFLFPKAKSPRQWHDRKKILDMPLFPSYIFVQINSFAEYYSIAGMDGFCYYVKFGKEVEIVNQRTIDDINLLVSKGENLEVCAHSFKCGQKLTINQGPLCGLSCEVVEHNNKLKVCVRINLLNRSILADIPSASLQNYNDLAIPVPC